VLELHGVPTTVGQGGQRTVTLVYERILARDCTKAYVDNSENFYNTNHPSFGCSVAGNMVQQVTDKQEFVNPSLADDPSAVRAVNDMRRAYTPRDIVKPYSVDESLAGKAKTSN
jgi:type IV pilus biogenesis protein CpaD/CtpE